MGVGSFRRRERDHVELGAVVVGNSLPRMTTARMSSRVNLPHSVCIPKIWWMVTQDGLSRIR